jgi:hypothetical protein
MYTSCARYCNSAFPGRQTCARLNVQVHMRFFALVAIASLGFRTDSWQQASESSIHHAKTCACNGPFLNELNKIHLPTVFHTLSTRSQASSMYASLIRTILVTWRGASWRALSADASTLHAAVRRSPGAPGPRRSRAHRSRTLIRAPVGRDPISDIKFSS